MGGLMTEVAVVVVSWNTRDLTMGCLQSVQAENGGRVSEVVVVDNASSDGTVLRVAERFPRVRVLRNERNLGFAAANNQGVAACRTQAVLLLNSDAQLLPGALPALLAVLEREPKTAVVGARLVYPDGSFQASHSRFPSLLREFMILSGLGRLLLGRSYPSRGPETERGPQAVDYVEGACLLVRRQAYEAVGGLDPGYFMYAEEVDLCRALRDTGWQVWYQPAAVVVHRGGGSSGSRPTAREADLYGSRVRYFRKHHGRGQAVVLSLMIYITTGWKQVTHSFLRLVTSGRRGRAVVGWRELRAALREGGTLP
jgi:GT2 family glycosyltransferase